MLYSFTEKLFCVGRIHVHALIYTRKLSVGILGRVVRLSVGVYLGNLRFYIVLSLLPVTYQEIDVALVLDVHIRVLFDLEYSIHSVVVIDAIDLTSDCFACSYM